MRALAQRAERLSSIIVAEIRVITSAPYGCWRLSIERTATGWPLSRSSSVATTVVVPRSNAIANRRAVVSPGSTSISSSSQTTAVTSKFDGAQDPAELAQQLERAPAARGRRSRRARAGGPSADPRASARRARGGASAPTGAGSRGARRRPAPPSAGSAAAAPRPPGPRARPRGTPAASPRAARSAVNARGSSAPTGTSPLTTRTLHFLQVPWPPQVESIAIPFQLAASNTGVPLGTRTSAPSGRNRSRTRLGAVVRRGQVALVALRRCGGMGRGTAHRAPRLLPPRAAWRARCAAIQLRAPGVVAEQQVGGSDRLDAHRRRRHDRARQPGGHRHRQERRVQHVPLGQPERDVRGAEAHVHAELVADQADRAQRRGHRLGVGADRHRERVDDHVRGRDPVVVRRR